MKWRGAGAQRALGLALTIVSAVCIAIGTLLPSTQHVRAEPWCIACGDFGGTDAILNILLFAPLGAGLALARARRFPAIAAMCAASVVIEVLQYTVIPGRDATLRDVVTNGLGGAIGFSVGASWWMLVFPSRRAAGALTSAWAVGIGLVQATAGFALIPAPAGARYFGQIGPALGGFPAYPGRVLGASIGGVAVPNTEFGDSQRMRALLGARRGAVVAAEVFPAAQTTWFAPVLRIADDEQREVLVLAQDQRDLVFGVRTGADVLRLRRLRVRLREVFPATPSSDTVHVQAHYSVPWIEMRAERDGEVHEARARVTPSDGWRLVLPAATWLGGSPWDAVGDVAWAFLLLAPAGYWAAWRAAAPRRGRASITADVRLSLAWSTGPAAAFMVPLAFGLAPGSTAGLLGAGAGLAAGLAAGTIAAARLAVVDAR